LATKHVGLSVEQAEDLMQHGSQRPSHVCSSFQHGS